MCLVIPSYITGNSLPEGEAGAICGRWIMEGAGMNKPTPTPRPSFREAFGRALGQVLVELLLVALAVWLAWRAVTSLF